MGFSGGMRDLFDGVLQNGARIVEALRVYKNPIYIYLPPKCELRGGAWAVIDTKINPERIEMYADSTARGGVLEPEGMVEIKYRDSQLVTESIRKARQRKCHSREAAGPSAAIQIHRR